MLANFACPHCNSTLQMDASHAGGQVRCPACSQVFTLAALPPPEPVIPTATLVQPPRQTPPAPQQPQQARTPKPARPTGTPPQRPGTPPATHPQQASPTQPRVTGPQRQGRPGQPSRAASRAPSATDTEKEERKAKLMLAGIAVGALALMGLVAHFSMKFIANADVTGLEASTRKDAERDAARQREAIREQLAEEAKASEVREKRRKDDRDLISMQITGGDDAVADALLTAFEEVDAEVTAAFQAGTLKGDPLTFSQQLLMKKMTSNPILRKWFGSRSQADFFAALTRQQEQAEAQAQLPGNVPPLLASGEYVSAGTGFHISQDGWIVTNQHVVMNSREVDVRTASGEVKKARVVKTDKAADLALLKTSASSSAWLPLSDGQATLGTRVFTIGFPQPKVQGIEPKFTDGTLSSLKGVQDDDRSYQISVPVQPGNSGGALVHLQSGWVVGVVCSRLTGGASQNVNYAVKSSAVRNLLKSTPEAKAVLDVPAPVNLEDPGEIIEKVKSATVQVLVRENG
jgi:serine protease Do